MDTELNRGHRCPVTSWGSTEAPERPHPGWSLKDMAVWSPEGLGRSLGKGSEAGAHWGVDAGRRWERLGQSEV